MCNEMPANQILFASFRPRRPQFELLSNYFSENLRLDSLWPSSRESCCCHDCVARETGTIPVSTCNLSAVTGGCLYCKKIQVDSFYKVRPAKNIKNNQTLKK